MKKIHLKKSKASKAAVVEEVVGASGAWYNSKTREDWIAWAKREIKEYQNFIKFLKAV